MVTDEISALRLLAVTAGEGEKARRVEVVHLCARERLLLVVIPWYFVRVSCRFFVRPILPRLYSPPTISSGGFL